MDRADLKALAQATGVAVNRGDAVFLCDPCASAEERSQAHIRMAETADPASEAGRGWLNVRTGGSGGTVKFARHDEQTFGAAVRGFCAHFEIPRANAVDVLPAHHVSGLMARVRCAATGGVHRAWAWKQLEAGDVPEISGDAWVISLVPTQLQRLLAHENTCDWLRRFRAILVGGGPTWPDLADRAAAARLPVALSYGLTETAAMVAALRPEEFLAGRRGAGRALPHARIALTSDGVVKISGESLFRGYWPAWDGSRSFTTEDRGEIDAGGYLQVLGRRDALIVSGGKKIEPSAVEAGLRASGEFDDVVVVGVPDAEWGETVVACYPQRGRAPDLDRAVAALPGHQRPKRFVALAEWPRNAQGKVNRAALLALLTDRRPKPGSEGV